MKLFNWERFAGGRAITLLGRKYVFGWCRNFVWYGNITHRWVFPWRRKAVDEIYARNAAFFDKVWRREAKRLRALGASEAAIAHHLGEEYAEQSTNEQGGAA